MFDETVTRGKIWRYIENYYVEHKYMPTAREISEEVGVSQNTVKAHFKILLRLGFIETDLVVENEEGEFTHTAWTTRGYRMGKVMPHEYKLIWNGEKYV